MGSRYSHTHKKGERKSWTINHLLGVSLTKKYTIFSQKPKKEHTHQKVWYVLFMGEYVKMDRTSFYASTLECMSKYINIYGFCMNMLNSLERWTDKKRPFKAAFFLYERPIIFFLLSHSPSEWLLHIQKIYCMHTLLSFFIALDHIPFMSGQHLFCNKWLPCIEIGHL